MKGPSSKQFGYHGRDNNNNSYKNIEPVAPHQNHHMSGAYIRGFVKQLSYAATTDSSNMSSHSGLGYPPGGEAQEQQQQHRPRHKKQVRRRLHTNRPYQDKLLNMAEARREIVTALKFHRAAMKEAAKAAADTEEQQQKPEAHTQPQYQSLTSQTQYHPLSASISSPLMSSNTANCCSNYNDYQRASFSSYLYPPPPPLRNHFDSPFSLVDENLINLQSLPSQTLGLNLNFNDFESVYHSSPSPSSPINTNSPIDTSTDRGGGMADFHAAMGEEEMEAIRWIGEQHQMEWGDTLNLVTSAWWFKVDHGEESKIECNDEEQTNNYVHVGPFWEHTTWLKGGPSYDDICSNQQQQRGFNDGSSSSSFHDPHAPPLPCVDNIGEIEEGLDMEWLS